MELSSQRDGSDVGVHTLVPVQVALDVDNIANIQGAHGGVDLGLSTGQVDFYTEIVGGAVVAQIDVHLVAGIAVCILDGPNVYAVESV